MRLERGYTLIELLVVMIITAILISMGLYSYDKYEDRAENRRAKSTLTTAHAAAMTTYERGRNFPASSTAMTSTLEDTVPELSFGAAGGGDDIADILDKNDPKKIFVQTAAPDAIVLCNRSVTGKIYCVKEDRGGLRVRKVNDDLAWAREIRLDDDNPIQALADVTASPVLVSRLGWDDKDGGRVHAEDVAPTARLNCDILAGQDPSCPNNQTPEDFAYFAWTLTKGVAAAADVECRLDGVLLSSCPIQDPQSDPRGELALCDPAKYPTPYPTRTDLDCLAGTSLAIGEHEFSVTASNDAGSSETVYNWAIIPDLPSVGITSISPSSGAFTTGTGTGSDPALRETTQRTITLDWEAEQVSGPTGTLQGVYCKLELAQADGSYTVVWDDNTPCPGPVKDTTRRWHGQVSFPAQLTAPYNVPLPFQNQTPHRFTVTAVNEAGASNNDLFTWRVVDHTPPTSVVYPANNQCYSPYGANGTNGSIGNYFVLQARGNDTNSGLSRIVWPAIGTNYIGTGGFSTSAISTMPVSNNVTYSSDPHGANGLYRFGTGSIGLSSTSTGTFNINIHNAAPPDYPFVSAPFTLTPDVWAPAVPAVSGGSGDGTAPGGSGWTTGDVTFTLSGASDTGCGGFDHYEFRYSLNGGAFTAPANVIGNTLPVTTEGYYELQFRSLDGVDNASAWSDSRYAKIDRTAPDTPVIDGRGLNDGVETSGTEASGQPVDSYYGSRYSYNNLSTYGRAHGGDQSCSGEQAFANWNGWTTCGTYITARNGGDNNHPYNSGWDRYEHCISGAVSGCAAGGRYVFDANNEQGISYIKFRSCDNLGHCGSYQPNWPGYGNQTSAYEVVVKFDNVSPTTGIPYVRASTQAEGTGLGSAAEFANGKSGGMSSYQDRIYFDAAYNDNFEAYGSFSFGYFRACTRGNGSYFNGDCNPGGAYAAVYNSSAGSVQMIGGSGADYPVCDGWACSLIDHEATVYAVDDAGNVGVESGEGAGGTGFATGAVKTCANWADDSNGRPCGFQTGKPSAWPSAYDGACGPGQVDYECGHAWANGATVARVSDTTHHGSYSLLITFTANGQGVAVPIPNATVACKPIFWANRADSATYYAGWVTENSAGTNTDNNSEHFDGNPWPAFPGVWGRMTTDPNMTAMNHVNYVFIQRATGGAGTLRIDDFQVAGC